MYDVQVIQDELMGLVGLRQTNDPNFSKLPPVLTKSANNVLIQHPLLNIENLDMTSRNYSEWVYPAYVPATEYNVGDRVDEAGIFYESKINANLGNLPSASPVQWVEVSLLALYLDDVFRNAIDDVVNGVILKKELRREVKTLLRSLALYEGVGNMNDLIVNEGDLVGFSIQLNHSRNLAAIINNIGTQFTIPGDLKLWLYHSSQQEVLEEIVVTRTKNFSFEWHDIDKKLQNLDLYDAAGTFYIMYDQAQAPGQALRRRVAFGIAPCATCSNYNLNAYNQYSKFLKIHAIRVPLAERNTVIAAADLLWDIDKHRIEQDVNFGLNFRFTVRCDLTNFLVENKDVFAFAIRDMATFKMLESIANSTRQNAIDEKVKSMALTAIQNGGVGGGGARQQAEKQISAIDFEFSGFNDVCMPCNNGNGLDWGSTRLNY